MSREKRMAEPNPDLKTWREKRAWSQAQAAAYLRVSQAFYCYLEKGRMFPKRVRAKGISEKTGVPVLTLLGID